jgi:hypothetical protein
VPIVISCFRGSREVGAGVGVGVALLVATLLVITGCARSITGTAGPVAAELPAASLPLDSGELALATVFATVRTWDMCAVHDVAAAASVTGYLPDELAPYVSLDTCKMQLKQPGGVNRWELTFSLSPVEPTGGTVPITVGGAQLPQVGYSSEASCSYSRPIGPDGEQAWGLTLTAFNVSANRPPCDVARDYAIAVAQRLMSPPLRSEGRTSPALTIGGSDPCAVAAELVPLLAAGAPVVPENVRASLSGAYGCSVAVPTNEGTPQAQDIRASVELGVDSETLEGAVVAGRPATNQSLGTDCALTFQASDFELAGNPGLPPTYETAQVTGDCEAVQGLADAAAQALQRSPQPAGPVEGAVVLGDLDVPPTPQQAGAPFDPCTVAGWAGYPPELQPSQLKIPAPMEVSPDSGYAVGCSFNTGPMFSSLVWGMPGGAFSADPAARPGSVPTQFGGKPGVEQTNTMERGEPVCYSAVQLANGIAAMSTVLPSGDPCAVNRPILEQVASRVP